MSELKATPGPWIVGNENNSSVDLQIGETFASFDREDLNTCETVISREEMLANAHLAAAASELYKALEAAMRFIDAHAADPDLTPEMVDAHLLLKQSNPHQALAKARGES